jgi:hypothetical protein
LAEAFVAGVFFAAAFFTGAFFTVACFDAAFRAGARFAALFSAACWRAFRGVDFLAAILTSAALRGGALFEVVELPASRAVALADAALPFGVFFTATFFVVVCVTPVLLRCRT